MSNISRYDKRHESEFIALLITEPDWNSFTSEGSIGEFKNALLSSESFICKSSNRVICGYIRALDDGFGVYVSELYIAPRHRNNGYGRQLLIKIKQERPDQDVYVLFDEDTYYEKLGGKRVGSVFQLESFRRAL